MGRLERLISGQGLFARVARGSAITAGSYVVSQVVRLAANLVLTRLLAPDAFGLMALVTMFIVGLSLFSDAGIGPSILQHRRGDDPEFLNTAWTIQVVRGVLLWLAACALAWPAAWFYEAPMLATILPVAALSLVVTGLLPTRIETANRHLMLGRVMGLDLVSQVIGIVLTVAAAWALQSVWALAIGGVAGAVVKLVLTSLFLPGPRNRLHWDRAAAHDLIHFGKWIFLSTVCGFFLMQGDRAILGLHLSLTELGIYNIGAFLATFPILLGQAVTGKVMIPLYREVRQDGGSTARRKLRRMRFALTGVLLALLAVLAFGGIWIVGLLYSADYAGAGAITVALACVLMVQVVGLGYDQAALSAGDSRNFFLVIALRAVLQTGLFFLGAATGGLAGALAGQAAAMALSHPALAWLAWRHGVWDGRHDLVYFGLVVILAGLALGLHLDAVAQLVAGRG